jgi:hypothetical protein
MNNLPDDIYYCTDCKFLHRNASHKPVHIPGVTYITDFLTGKVHPVKQSKKRPKSKYSKSKSKYSKYGFGSFIK